MADESEEKKPMNPAIQRIVFGAEMRLVSPEEVKMWTKLKKRKQEANEKDLPKQSEQTKPTPP